MPISKIKSKSEKNEQFKLLSLISLVITLSEGHCTQKKEGKNAKAEKDEMLL